LIDFAKKYEFQSVGVFGYHDEHLAKSYKLENKIDDKTINVRVAKIKKVLDKIYLKQEKERKKEKQV
jgi:tRNA A37 methylthiotransferase MiaB